MTYWQQKVTLSTPRSSHLEPAKENPAVPRLDMVRGGLMRVAYICGSIVGWSVLKNPSEALPLFSYSIPADI